VTQEPRTRVAVVGTGPWWGREHARVYSERADVDLCAVVGSTPERAAARAQEVRAAPYVDLGEMLEREQPDLVSLCLANERHFEPTLKVIRAGFPLLVEKPLVFDLDQADVLLREAESRALFFAINFNHRYATPVAMAADAIRAGDLGELVFATWRFGGEPGTSAHTHANLIETQCHGLDMLEHLCGPIDSVTTQMTDKTGRGYSTLVAALHFANGAVGSLVGSYDASYTYPGTHQLELNGTSGRILVEDTVQRYTFTQAGSEVSSVWQAGYFNDADRQFHRTFDKHVDALLTAFRKNQEPPVHARAGRRALVLALAIIASFETGTRVDVPVLPAPEGA
jgi:myo-inositol 2-dehydrogenase / D-chiro-inositol 1-dehydrogenase